MAVPNLPIREFMSPVVDCVEMETTLPEAQEIMRTRGIRHLPVLDGERLVGVISERELLILQSCGFVDRSLVSVPDAMADEPYTVGPDTPLEIVVREMATKKYGSAVVTEDRKVLGIFTTIDALNVLNSFLHEASSSGS